MYDALSRPCGLTDATKDYKLAYFTNPGNNDKNWKMMVLCVKSCPTNATVVMDCAETDSTRGCVGWNPAVSSTFNTYGSKALAGTANLIMDTKPFYGTLCLPNMASEYGKALKPMLDVVMGFGQKVADDIYHAAWVVGVCVLVSLFMGLFYMCFLRLFAGLLVFLTICAYLASLTVLGFMMLTESKELDNNGASQDNYKYIAYLIWGIAVISALFFCCFRNALRLAVAIVKSAGLFLMDCKTVLLVPILGYVTFLAVFAFWLVGFVYLFSMGDPKRMDTYPFNTFQVEGKNKQYLYFWLFMGLWKQAFISALVQFVIASSCVIWYFSQGSG